jgi:hypothetical protein
VIDLALLGRVVIRQLRRSDAASDLRAMLPNGAAGIIHAEKLRNATVAPRTPFIAMRRGGFGSSDGVVDTGVFRLFIYGHPDDDYWPLNQIASALPDVFDALPGDPGLALDRPHVASTGEESYDSELSLLLIVCELAIAGV